MQINGGEIPRLFKLNLNACLEFFGLNAFFFSLTTTSGVSFVWGASQLGILLFGCRGQLQDSLIS